MGEALIRVVSQTWYKNDVEKQVEKWSPGKKKKKEKNNDNGDGTEQKKQKIEKNKKAQDTKKYK